MTIHEVPLNWPMEYCWEPRAISRKTSESSVLPTIELSPTPAARLVRRTGVTTTASTVSPTVKPTPATTTSDRLVHPAASPIPHPGREADGGDRERGNDSGHGRATGAARASCPAGCAGALSGCEDGRADGAPSPEQFRYGRERGAHT